MQDMVKLHGGATVSVAARWISLNNMTITGMLGKSA